MLLPVVQVPVNISDEGGESDTVIGASREGNALPRRLPRLATPWTHLSCRP